MSGDLAVCFDLDRTLVDYDPAIPRLFAPALSAHGVSPDEERLSTLVDRVVTNFAALDGDPFEAAARDLRPEWGFDATPRAFADALVESERAALWVDDTTAPTLRALTDAGVQVGVVTNGYRPVQRGKLEETGLWPFVDTLVTPGDVGGFKPDPRMFELARERLPADRYVLVGDSVESDIRPAREQGFTTVLVGGVDEAADHTLAGPRDLGRLPGLLGLDGE